MFDKIVSDQEIAATKQALEKNGFKIIVVESAEKAKEAVISIIPQGAEVMTMTSVTLEETGILEEINNSGKYKANREVLWSDKSTVDEKKRAGNLADWTVGSVHAITLAGQVVIASGTGSQLPAYVYTSDNVVWVVGAQKIVKDINMAMERINTHLIPLESVRARKAYGLPDTWNTSPNKILIYNRELREGRVTIVIVKEKLGF